MNQLALRTTVTEPEPEMAMPRRANDPLSERQRVLLLSLSAVVALLAHVLFLLLLPQPWRRNQSSDYSAYYEPVATQLDRG
jgi:hypothetical protein